MNILDQLSVGVVVVNRSAKVVFANEVAKTLSLQDGPLRLNSCVTSLSSPHARRLCELIRSALEGTPTRTMCLPSSAGGRPLMVLISPVGEMDRSSLRGLRDAAAMIIVCDPDRATDIPPAWLTEAYGLTHAEARVALAVASGTTIPDAARELRISPNTVKTHLRRVYEKTGTCRQTELSRLMATISVASAARPAYGKGATGY